MQTLVVMSNNTQKIKVVKQLLKALDMPFKAKNNTEYNPEFIAKIQKSEEDYKVGRFKTIKTEDLWK